MSNPVQSCPVGSLACHSLSCPAVRAPGLLHRASPSPSRSALPPPLARFAYHPDRPLAVLLLLLLVFRRRCSTAPHPPPIAVCPSMLCVHPLNTSLRSCTSPTANQNQNPAVPCRSFLAISSCLLYQLLYSHLVTIAEIPATHALPTYQQHRLYRQLNLSGVPRYRHLQPACLAVGLAVLRRRAFDTRHQPA